MLRRFLMCAATILILSASVMGQAREEDSQPSALDVPSNVQVSPEMYLYLREFERYQDPRNVVRRNAEERAAQRRGRIAAMNWFGFSNSRPQASPTPFMSTYSPTWASNTWDPYSWAGVGAPVVVYLHGN